MKPEVTAFMPTGELRIAENPNANGGRIREELKLPKLEDYEVKEVAEYGHGWRRSRPSSGRLHPRHHQERLDSFRIFRTGRDRF